MSCFQKYRAAILALGAYIILAVILTYPLVLNLTTHVPGDGSDDPALAWNLWWVPHAIINLGTSPIYCDYMFFPIGLNLAFYTLTYLNAFLSIPFQYAFNLVVAANVNLWFSFVVGGFGAYLLVKYLLQVSSFRFQVEQSEPLNLKLTTFSAFVTGALYAFSSNKFLYASLGQFNIASSHWIPFYVLFLLKSTHNSQLAIRNAARYGFLLGLLLLFQALSEFIYASFLIIFTVVYLAYWLLTERPKLSWIYRPLFTFLIAILVFTIPMSPILAAMFQDMALEGDFIQQGLGFADVFSSDALGFFVPSHLHPLFGDNLLDLEAQFHFAYVNFAYLGFVALALALVALWKIPQARVWGVLGAIFVSISLGPALSVNGARFDLPLPFDLLLEIPFVKGNRYPSRWSVMVTLALAVLVGYGIAWFLERVGKQKAEGKRWLLPTAYCLLLSALLFEHLSIPLPLSDMRIPDIYRTIAHEQGAFSVLEIPLAWRNGFRMTGTLDTEMMFTQWYQTAHQRPILGGNTSRNPELKFQYFTEAPVINSIIAVETGHDLDDARVQQDKQLAPAVLQFFGIKYVVWHSPRNPQNSIALDATRRYIEVTLPVTKFYDATDETGQTIAYRVNALPRPNQTTLRSDDQMARLNFAEGWGTLGGSAVWATRREAKMFVPFDTPRDATFALRAFAPMSDQRVAVSINGNTVGNFVLQAGWGDYTLDVKRQILNQGINEIVLRFDTLAPVASVQEGDFAIGKTGITSPISIVVRSAGSEVGDFAHIYVNGIDAAPNLRGYNIVVINEKTATIESSAAFDTFSSADESARLAQFVAKTPNGRIVAVAVRDEASRFLSEEAVSALRSIGMRGDLRGKFRWSHAIIGVKGATSESALEAANEIAPVQLCVGTGAMEANVAAAIEWVRLEPH